MLHIVSIPEQQPGSFPCSGGSCKAGAIVGGCQLLSARSLIEAASCSVHLPIAIVPWRCQQCSSCTAAALLGICGLWLLWPWQA